MVDREILARRLERLEECVRLLRGLASVPKDRFLKDAGLQAQAERWLHLAVQAAIDIAHHVTADRRLPTPATYRDAFLGLAGAGILDQDLADRMAAWAGLRNVLVHAYLDVDHARLHGILTGDLDELERFAAAIARATPDDDEA